MRLPLIPILLVFAICIAIDIYIDKRMRNCRHSKTLRLIHRIVAALTNLALIAVICLPKTRVGEDVFEVILWTLFVYMSVYIPKFIFVIFDLLGSIPLLFKKKRIKTLSIIGAVIGASIFALLWWGTLINRYMIDVEEVEIEIEGLPKAFDGYRIAQFSDIHVGTFGNDTSFVSRVVDRINDLDADAVVFTGDIVNRKTAEIKPFVAPFSRLHARDGVYSILGNHDYGDYYRWPSTEAKEANLANLIETQKRMGWQMLNNDHRMIYRVGDSIAIVGVENVGDPPFHTYGDLDEAYPTAADGVTKILLSHNPAHWLDDIKDAPDKNIALTLSGHTHAMQMRLFGWSPSKYRYPTWGGLYDDGEGHQLYVNIGVGEVGFPARIGATPEITLFTLRAK